MKINCYTGFRRYLRSLLEMVLYVREHEAVSRWREKKLRCPGTSKLEQPGGGAFIGSSGIGVLVEADGGHVGELGFIHASRSGSK
jgi:hypothetical protein